MSHQDQDQAQNQKQKQNSGRPGFQPKWKFAQEFTCEKTGVSVVVTKTNHRVPQYSFKIGRYKGEEGSQMLPYIGARVTKENIFSGTLETDNLDAAIDMLNDAKEWAKSDLAYECDHAQQQAEQHEALAANRDKPETRHTGKTARKKGVTPSATVGATA